MPFSCPWCGAPNVLLADPAELGQCLVQDCTTCCGPVELQVPEQPDNRPEVRREVE
ncbi:MAG: hypothetical protein Kow0020_02430 [Wenzhouxiangellaceae bacterium]